MPPKLETASIRTEVVWLVNRTLAHATAHVECFEQNRSYTIKWLMGPDGEVCDDNCALYGSVVMQGAHGLRFPYKASVSPDEVLNYVRHELAFAWGPDAPE